MTDSCGGRVLPGEDSEEDDDNEEEINYSFNSLKPQLSPATLRFTAPIFATSLLKEYSNEQDTKINEEDEEKDDDDGMKLSSCVKKKIKDMQKETIGEDDEEEDDEEEMGNISGNMELETTGNIDRHTRWRLNDSMNGVEIMSNAFVDILQPSLNATIYRIAELKESQQRLLRMLIEQNTGIRSNKKFEDAAVVLEKLPFYSKKLEGIKLAMQEISNVTEKIKRRAEDLRIDAQSHAIKKENKRDALSQWNKLYAAKSTSAALT